jgi:hypothetical protein
MDDHLDSGSTHAVMNSAITTTILENEEVTAAALNDLNERKADITYVSENYALKDDMSDFFADATYCGDTHEIIFMNANGDEVGSVSTDDFAVAVDDHLDSASTNPVENRVLYQIITDDEEAIAAALNDLNDRKADVTDVTNLDNRVTIVEEAIESLSGGGITGVTYSGSGPIVANVSKSNNNLVVTKTNEIGGVTGFTAQTIDVQNLTANTINATGITANTLDVDNITAQTILTNTITGNTANFTGMTATTISATTYNNLPTASTTNYGMVIMDDHLDTGSTHAVMNSAITQTIIHDELVTAAALNDLNDRKANVEDVPVSINDLEGAGDIALKTDLAGFLPLSGGTMTGNISGSTGCAVYMPGGFFQQSDETLKIFMGDVENALEKANKIPTKYFYWNNMPDGPRQLGTSAQKVQEVFPEIVSGNDKLSVDYSKLAIVALAAVKELTAKVEDLQNQLNELKK